MVNTKNVNVKNPGQPGVQGLLYVSIASVFLAIGNPAFAYTEAAQIKAMQNKLNDMQNQLSQVTSGLANQSSADKGSEGC